MEAFPAFFPLKGRRVIIAGEGDGAEAKARLFDGSPAQIDRLTGAAALDPAAYAGASLAFVASPDPAFRAAAAAAARAAHVPLNVVDQSDLCDFHTPAVIDRGQVVAAVGTAGAAPILAAMLRTDIEAHVPPGAGRVAALLQLRQDAVRAAYPDLPARRAFLRAALSGPAAQAAMDGDMTRAMELLDQALAGGSANAGRVSLILGASTPDLISVRAARVLAGADVVIAPPSAEALVAGHARRDAERSPQGDALALALEGRVVAIVAEAEDAGLAARLAGAGVAFEVLRPAPAS